jgi:8-oxo-dGTP pyrophosphatase MutT (NUDIX family)
VARIIRKDRRLAATNSRWKVYLDHLADDHGNEVPDYLVVEALNSRADLITGVCVLPLVGERFVLLRCYRHALGTDVWEAPRGFIDEGEKPEQAALRELEEETGLHCRPEDLVALGHYAPEASTLSARSALYVASRCDGTLRAPTDEIGLDAPRLFDAREMAAAVMDRSVEDAGTLIAYYQHTLLRQADGIRP